MFLGVSGMFTGTALAASPPSNTAVPQFTGPLSTTPASYAWNAANQNATPLILANSGYQEQEYLVSGRANVYTWSASNTAEIQTPNVPYTSRILVRRPVSAASFSGNVVVELLNPSYGYDMDFMWAASHNYLIASGDAWIGVTMRPSSIASLRQFDALRYASLSMANPLAASATCASPGNASTPAAESGLAWDMISQVGVLARTSSGSSPMAGLTVQKVYATGYSDAANALQIYANAISPWASQSNGSPVFDGFLVGAATGGINASIHQCAPWISAGDPRIVIQPNRSPVIRVNTMSDSGYYFAGPEGIGMAANATANRRPDSDAPNDRFRGYEIPGATHLWAYQLPNSPGAAETARIGAVPMHACGETPINNFPLHYFFDGAFSNLDIWARGGASPPHAPPITMTNVGTDDEAMVLDKNGNPLGGVRSPQLDLARTTYVWYNTGAGCGSGGHMVPLARSALQSLYPTDLFFETRLIDSAFALVANHWVPEMDGRNIILDSIRGIAPFSA